MKKRKKRYELLDETVNLENLEFEEVKKLLEAYNRGDALSPEEEKLVKALQFTLSPESLKIGIDVIAYLEPINGKIKVCSKKSVILNTKLKLALPLYSYAIKRRKWKIKLIL